MNRSDLTGIILAGGKSSRMGTEKGLVEFRGKPLIQYALDLLSLYTDRILISSGNPDYHPFGCTVVPDDIAGQGPAAGLAATLKVTETAWNLVLACDLPFMAPEMIDRLIENASDCQAVIPIQNGNMEPLSGLYHKSLGENFAHAVSVGNLALYKILSSCRVHFIDATDLQTKHPGMFNNLNSFEDLMTN